MKVTKAVIPAAGLGTRVLPATKAFGSQRQGENDVHRSCAS